MARRCDPSHPSGPTTTRADIPSRPIWELQTSPGKRAVWCSQQEDGRQRQRKTPATQPLWPPRTRQLSELEANETPGQPTPRQWKGSIRPQRVATASAQGPCRELASEAARGVGVRGRSVGKPVDDYRRERIRIGQPAPSALQEHHSSSASRSVSSCPAAQVSCRRRILCRQGKKDWIGSMSKGSWETKTTAISTTHPSEIGPSPLASESQETTYVEVLPTR